MMRSTGRVGRVIVALALALVTVACGAVPGPSPTPPPSIEGPLSPAASGSMALPSSSAANPPAGLIDWREVPAPEVLRGAQFDSVARLGNRFLGLGCLTGQEGCVKPAIWESQDGLEWEITEPMPLPPDSSGGRVVAVASSAMGTVAAGNVTSGDKSQASIWLRAVDGWAQITPQSAGDSIIHAMIATDRRAFAIGSGAFLEAAGFRAWWSPDGTTWLAATLPADELGGYPLRLLPVGDRLLAWGPSCGGVCVATTAWWSTADGTSWRSAETPHGLEGAYVQLIAATEGGFEAFGAVGGGDQPSQPAAWVSDRTAAEWLPVRPPPGEAAAAILHHLRVGGGAVVAASAGGPTGLAGYIWLRRPGDGAWGAPMQLGLPNGDIGIVAVIQHPEQLDRIIVIGQSYEGSRVRLIMWTGLVDWAA
jgi:hypothetical protein